MSKITPRGPHAVGPDIETRMAHCATVSFGKIGNRRFCLIDKVEPEINDTVIFQDEQGREVGLVIEPPAEREVPAEQDNRVLRVATEEDLEHIEKLRVREAESFETCKERILSYDLPMRLLAVDWRFDYKKVTFHFCAEGRVDFRALVRDLASIFRCRIELHQVGVRDQSKLIGGYGICGREFCCSGYLRGFNPISMKMARTQNLPINPGKLSGVCGRLKCCLAYEFEHYAEKREGLVDPGTRLRIDGKELTVANVNILDGRLVLRDDQGKRTEMTRCEFCKSGYETVSVAPVQEEGKLDTPHHLDD